MTPTSKPSQVSERPRRGFDHVGLPDALDRGFAAAASATGVCERDFGIAGARVRLRCAGQGNLELFSRAFAHLRARGAGDPALTIEIWDSVSGRVAAPPTPDPGDERAPGAFFYSSDARLRVGFQLGTSGDAREWSMYSGHPTPVMSVLDAHAGRAWHWVEDARRVPYWDQAAPMRFLLDWWLRDRGVHLLHAGAVGTPEGGVLLVGKSGSGKSTASLAALQSELLYAADDYVAVGLEPAPYIHSLFGSGKLMPDHIRMLPFLAPALANGGDLDTEKAVVYAREHWPGNVSSGFPLKAVVAPRVVHGSAVARVREISPLDGLAAVAPSTVFQMHTRGQDSLARMRELVATVPSYSLEMGSDIASIPLAIADLLARLP